jgi:DNA gyrase subunit A
MSTGRGSMRVRARYDVRQDGKLHRHDPDPAHDHDRGHRGKGDRPRQAGQACKEITDIRDETGLDGLKITIDLKRGADPDKLMQKLFRMTTLEDSFACNFNILIAGMCRVCWACARCLRSGRRSASNASAAARITISRRKRKSCICSTAWKAILLDIDKAVRIVRETEEEAEVVPNLMIGFGIDEVQAEYVAEIRLRHLNREFILAHGGNGREPGSGHRAIWRHILNSVKNRIKTIIIARAGGDRASKYGQPRRSLILYEDEMPEDEPEDEEHAGLSR